ncbi:MAG: glycosyltransferase [Rhizomicrobium sp.]
MWYDVQAGIRLVAIVSAAREAQDAGSGLSRASMAAWLRNAVRFFRAPDNPNRGSSPAQEPPPEDAIARASQPAPNSRCSTKGHPTSTIAFLYRTGAAESGINIYCTLESYIHVGFRPAEKKIVLNTCSAGMWDTEIHIIEPIQSGLYELQFHSPPFAVLRFGSIELLSLSLCDRTTVLPSRLYGVAVYGNISILTRGAHFVTTVTPELTVLHSPDSDLLRVLRGQCDRMIESLRDFDSDCYIDLNPDLHNCLGTKAECIVHFLEHGIPELRQFSDEGRFDPEFYRARYGDTGQLAPPEAYVHWLSVGRHEGRPACEAMWLRRLGLTISEFPPGFTTDGYVRALTSQGLSVPAIAGWSTRSEQSLDLPVGHFRTRWDAFEHWIGHIKTVGALPDVAESALIFTDLADTCARGGSSPEAAELYRRSLLLNRDRVETWQHLGDALLRQSDHPAARDAYLEVIALGGASFWTHYNLISARRGCREFSHALEGARALARAYPERPETGELVDDLWLEHFELRRNEARSLVAHGKKSEACAHIRSIFEEPDFPPIPNIPQRRDCGSPLRVLIFGTPYLAQCKFYRIEQKLEQLRLAGITADFISQDDPRQLLSSAGSYDAVIFFRVPASPLIETAILYCRSIGVITIYETDDLVFDPDHFPDSFKSYRGALTVEEYANLVVDAPMFERAMALCEYGLASTSALQRRMEQLVTSNRCFLHRNALDSRHERFIAAMETKSVRAASSGVRLFYATGTKAHNEDFEVLAAPAIAGLFEHEPGLELVTMGFLPLPAVLLPFANRITQLPPNWNTNMFWSVLATADINLSVVKSGPFSDCKSEIKWIEAAMFGIPSILSSTSSHTEFLNDGHDAMLASSNEDWHHKLRLMVDSRRLRNEIGQNARRLVLARHGSASAVRNISEIISSVIPARGSPGDKSPRKPLVLLVNVYFFPQTIGGGTRVLKDNLDYLCDQFGDEFDFQVFCGVEGARTPYQTHTYFYRDVRVTSVTYPMRAGMDWLPADEEIGRIFRAHLELWKPSLVHFHGIQRLSVCVVEAARELGIPYVIMLHDGWWISDYQFLVDESGKDVSNELLDPVRSLRRWGAEGYPRIERSLRLRAALSGAARILAVSREFERLHRRHCITNIDTIENGVSDMKRPERVASSDGSVRLGYLGNVAAHKGYTLIKRAFHSTNFRNISLTIVDHALAHRERRPRETWGTTSVYRIGRFPQSKVVELYEKLDVLLAPSIWPESYGLVAREALQNGLWVIASNRGAIGADVVQGMNGFVIDVGDTSGLVAALTEIDQHPSRYRSSPAAGPHLRRAEEQAKELATLYRQLLSASGQEDERISTPATLQQ